MRHVLPLALLLCACQIIGTTTPKGFKCDTGGACSDGLVCCSDNTCRASCEGVNGDGGTGGGSSSNGGGSNSNGGGSTGTGGGGGTVDCTPDAGCTENAGAPCLTGVISCALGAPICVDGRPLTDGTSCGTQMICSGGHCITCVNGAACATNPTRCKNGALTCTGTPTCNDGIGFRDAGATCDVDKVCSPSGTCVDCAAGTACSTNDGGVCIAGVVACGSGAPTCANAGPQPGGTGCGSGKVCDGSGGCITCTVGAACSTNPDPCKTGKQQCGASAACADDQAKAPGASCGQDKVCSSAGACNTCVQGAACSTNPTPCKNGVTDCSTGAPVCNDGTMTQGVGAACGTNKVCNSSGMCIACAQGGTCTSNPSPCKAGIYSCATGSQSCIDTTSPLTLGALCPGGFCDGASTCIACSLGATCNTNPGHPCRAGTYARSGGSCVCSDGVNQMEGQTCATTTFGNYTACSYADPTCSNSGTRTRPRTDFTCVSGACDSAMTTDMDSSGCARNQDGMTCTPESCGAFGACSNAGLCATTGTRSRTCTDYTCGSSTCNSAMRQDNDTAGCNQTTTNNACTGGFCNASGSCISCNVGAGCATNPNAPCKTGIVAWSTASAACVCSDNVAVGNGTACPNGLCYTGACCTGCWTGAACVSGNSNVQCGSGGDHCISCGICKAGISGSACFSGSCETCL